MYRLTLLVKIVTVLALSHLCAVDEGYQHYGPAPTARGWRLMSSQLLSGWSSGWEGGNSQENKTFYYDSIWPEHPDSILTNAYHSNSSSGDWYTSTMQVNTYVDSPGYYQIDGMINDLIYPQYSNRVLDRYDDQDRLLLHISYRYATPESPEYEKQQYAYDAVGNLLEKVEWKSYPAPYGPKTVIRNTYRQDSQLLTKHTYSVSNGNLDDLVLTNCENRIYNLAGQMIAKFTAGNSQYFYKYLYDYTPQGLLATFRGYSSSDSLSWRLDQTIETSYGMSYGELKPFRVDTYRHAANDSTNVTLQQYSVYTYLDENRDIFEALYNATDSTGYKHSIYNAAMKLIDYSESNYYAESSNNVHRTYVWDTFVANSDPVMPEPITRLSVNPNPVRSRFEVSYDIHKQSAVVLDLYNLRGQKVKHLDLGSKSAGIHKLELEATEVGMSSGLYFMRLTIDGNSTSRKIVVVK